MCELLAFLLLVLVSTTDFHLSHLYLPLISLSTASVSLPGKAYHSPVTVNTSPTVSHCVHCCSATVCADNGALVSASVCVWTMCFCVSIFHTQLHRSDTHKTFRLLPSLSHVYSFLHKCPQPKQWHHTLACVCMCVPERPCCFSHCLRISVNTRAHQAHIDISKLYYVLSMRQASANITRPLITSWTEPLCSKCTSSLMLSALKVLPNDLTPFTANLTSVKAVIRHSMVPKCEVTNDWDLQIRNIPAHDANIAMCFCTWEQIAMVK